MRQLDESLLRLKLKRRRHEIAAEEGGDLAWAKTYVDEALADVARGDAITLEEHEANNDARLAAMKT
jgi:antitoxin ParD1/3/4